MAGPECDSTRQPLEPGLAVEAVSEADTRVELADGFVREPRREPDQLSIGVNGEPAVKPPSITNSAPVQ